MFSVYLEGGANGDHDVYEVYAKAGDTELASAPAVPQGWKIWQNPQIRFTVNETTEVMVGMRATATGSAWGTWDDAYLYKDVDLTPTPDVTKNGLVTVDGVTYYYIKGVVQENYTGFVKSNSIQYYVKAGIVQAAYKGLVTSSKTGNIWLVKNGMVYSSYIGFYKNAKGQQCYIYKGKFQNAKSGFAKSPKTGKIYYIRKGIVQYGYTGFIKNPASGNQCYVVKGVFQGSKTGVVKSPKTGVKYYVKSGRVSYKTTGIVKISGVKYKVVKGVVKGIVK